MTEKVDIKYTKLHIISIKDMLNTTINELKQI